MSLQELWNAKMDLPIGLCISLGVLFLAFGMLFYGVCWYLQKEAMIEYGYPRVSPKTMRKKFAKYTFLEKITLSRLKKSAKRQGFMLQLCSLINWLNLFFAVITCIGFFGFTISRGAGWSVLFLLFLPFGWLLLSAAIRFIPDLICLPSERHRYFRR